MALVLAHQYHKLHEQSAYQYRTSRPSSHDHGQTAQHQRRAATTALASPAANPTYLPVIIPNCVLRVIMATIGNCFCIAIHSDKLTIFKTTMFHNLNRRPLIIQLPARYLLDGRLSFVDATQRALDS